MFIMACHKVKSIENGSEVSENIGWERDQI